MINDIIIYNPLSFSIRAQEIKTLVLKSNILYNNKTIGLELDNNLIKQGIILLNPLTKIKDSYFEFKIKNILVGTNRETMMQNSIVFIKEKDVLGILYILGQ